MPWTGTWWFAAREEVINPGPQNSPTDAFILHLISFFSVASLKRQKIFAENIASSWRSCLLQISVNCLFWNCLTWLGVSILQSAEILTYSLLCLHWIFKMSNRFLAKGSDNHLRLKRKGNNWDLLVGGSLNPFATLF